MSTRKTKSSSLQESTPAKQPSTSETEASRTSRTPESSEEFHPPSTQLLDESLILPVANMEVMRKWWYREWDVIEESYSWFVQQNYFVNKFGFIELLLQRSRREDHAIFMPTGCSKTITSLSLEFFLSHQVKQDQRAIVNPIYSTVLKPDFITQHEGQYHVLRFSLRKFPYAPDEPFALTFFYFLQEVLEGSESELFKNDTIREHKGRPGILSRVITWLYEKYEKKLVVIIDEIDYMSNMYMHRNATEDQEKNFRYGFDSVLAGLSNNQFVRIAVLFGIHPPQGILRSRHWRICDVCQKDIASFFMFTSDEVKHLLGKYSLTCDISKVQNHYGNYCHGLFCPASVIAFVTHSGNFCLYKWCRRSCDIMSLNLKVTQSWLTPFVDGEAHKKEIDVENIYFTWPIAEDVAVYHYVFAGLLRTEIPEDHPGKGVFKFSAGNLENLNMIAIFLEKMVNVRSNYALIDAATKALNECDFKTLSGVLDDLFRSFKPMEPCSEQNFQNPIIIFFKFIPGWDVKSEVDNENVNVVTGDSGRTALRMVNDSLKYLFIFELKFVPGSVVTKNPLIIETRAKTALKQISVKGYVTPVDRQFGYAKIIEIGTVCHGKVITMVSQPYDESRAKSIVEEFKAAQAQQRQTCKRK